MWVTAVLLLPGISRWDLKEAAWHSGREAGTKDSSKESVHAGDEGFGQRG